MSTTIPRSRDLTTLPQHQLRDARRSRAEPPSRCFPGNDSKLVGLESLQMLILESLQNIENKSDFPIKDDDLVGGFPGT